jgi:hypothetical protein
MALNLKQNSRGMTRLLISLPISTREALHDASRLSTLSQQSIIRIAVTKYLQQYDDPTPEPTPEPVPVLPHKLRVVNKKGQPVITQAPKRTSKPTKTSKRSQTKRGGAK